MASPEFTTKIARRLTPLLMTDEQVLAVGQRHWLSYSRAINFGLLAALATGIAFALPAPDGALETGSGRVLTLYAAALFWGLCLLQILQTAFINWTIVMAVTNRRVFMRTGFIARDIVDIPLAKLDIVNLEQGVLGRIFGCGDVLVRTVGEVTTRFPLISNPTGMRNAIVQAMETAAGHKAQAAKAD